MPAMALRVDLSIEASCLFVIVLGLGRYEITHAGVWVWVGCGWGGSGLVGHMREYVRVCGGFGAGRGYSVAPQIWWSLGVKYTPCSVYISACRYHGIS